MGVSIDICTVIYTHTVMIEPSPIRQFLVFFSSLFLCTFLVQKHKFQPPDSFDEFRLKQPKKKFTHVCHSLLPSFRSSHVRRLFIQQEHIQIFQINKSYSNWAYLLLYHLQISRYSQAQVKVLTDFSSFFWHKENSMVKFLSQS